MKDSFQEPSTIISVIVAIMGMDSGMTILMNVLNSPEPSSSAASISDGLMS